MKLALIGYGRMGHAVEAAADERGHSVVVRLDLGDEITKASLAGADVAIDFTLADAVVENARRVTGAGVRLVIGTTGWYQRMDELKSVVRETKGGCLWSPNFSLGVNAFFRIAAEAARMADAVPEMDVAIHEWHHVHKLDHPSGTAIRLAQVLLDQLARKTAWKEGPGDGTPDPSVLYVTSTREGEIPGIHEVTLEGPSDSIVVRHTARGREGFARGAVEAAEWLAERTGFFGMDDMLAERFGRRRDEQEIS